MNSREDPALAELVEVPTDRLRRDVESAGQILDRHPPERAGKLDNLALAVAQRLRRENTGVAHCFPSRRLRSRVTPAAQETREGRGLASQLDHFVFAFGLFVARCV